MQLKVNLLDFNNKITSLDDYPWVISYNEYLLTVLDGNLSLINRNTDDIISIMHFEDAIQIPSLHIYKDKLIFAVETCVYVLDLITGDKKSYNAKEVYPLLEKIEDSAFIDNNIYASYGSKDLIRIDLNKDEIRGYVFIDNRTDTYSYLQTDGERLFASVYQLDPATFKITATGYDELFIPPSGNELTRKEFGQ